MSALPDIQALERSRHLVRVLHSPPSESNQENVNLVESEMKWPIQLDKRREVIEGESTSSMERPFGATKLGQTMPA